MENNQFTWVPFFKEVHEKIHTNYNAKQLAIIANEIFGHIKDIDDSGNEVSIQEMSPINFIGYFNRRLKLRNRVIYCEKLKEIMNLISDIPKDFDGIPEFNNTNCLCMPFKKDRASYIIQEQWKISKEILENHINIELFDKILSNDHPYIGLSYLSRFCFIVKPEKYYPYDKQMAINLNAKMPETFKGYEDYCKLLKDTYPKKTSYELSYEAFIKNNNKWNQKTLTDISKKDIFMNSNQDKLKDIIPLNQILYGPPGTGKTYNTIIEAMKIINPSCIQYDNGNVKNYDEVKREFNNYKQEGQIEFVTFHQSYSYEEFVEGIKPDLNGDNLGYKLENGIFKNICEHAKPIATTTKHAPIDFSNTKVFKMSLGNTLEKEDDIYDYCIENNVVSLGWKDTDFSNCKTSQDFKSLDNSWGATALERFVKWMDIGDIIIISNGNMNFRAIAQVKSDYFYDNNTPISHTHFRKVEWLYKGEDIHYSKINNKLFSQQSIYGYFSTARKGQPDYNPDLKTDELNKIITGEINKEVSKPHILIIDEINRGNISKIFGELITLIEEDKRENLSVTLPYSKETFSVPKNLYIIGTMNTSDRSIASIDIALRRRFKFKEMMPKKELVANFGIGFDEIFEKLNTNIKILLDRDHQIGHSYFIKTKYENADINVLKTIWFSEIMPLLNEYFYCDWEKLKLIIPGFINKSKVPDNFQNECDEFLYEFKTFDEVTDFETVLKQEKFE